MGTGARHLAINNKMILGTQDLDDRFFQYLLGLIQEGVAAHWNVDGAFSVKLGLSGGTNTVSVTGTSLATDGLGHIIDVGQAYPDASAVFENTNGVTYYVGLRYAQVPAGIVINPRTGKPNYQAWEDVIGESASPTEVTDNGDGTITFNVNSVTEASVTNAGRKVRVYRNTPADLSLTSNIAIEELTVSYNGGTGKNTITTAGTLGQDAVSTTAGDYTVVLMGISVRRNFNLETSPNHMFVGTVAGVGVGGTPAVFNTANQRLLKTFQDASQVIFSPYKWLTSSTVQEALQLVPDTLERVTNGTAGANYIGVYTTGFTKKDVGFPQAGQQPAGGIGNNADSTFNAASRLQDVLVEVEGAIRRRQAWTATFGDQSNGYVTDYNYDQFGAVMDVGSYFFRYLPQPGTKYYQLPSSGLSVTAAPYIHGEVSDPGGSPESKTRIAVPNDGSSTAAIIRGAYKRVYFDANHNGTIQLGGSSGSNLVMEDFGLRACYASLADMRALVPQPFHLRNGVIRPTNAGTDNGPLGASLSLIHAGTGENWAHGIVENVVIDGPATSQAGAIANFNGTLTGVAMGSQLIRPLVFRNCVFRQTSDVPCVLLSGTYRYVFENCSFIGASGLLSYLFIASGGANVELKNCYFYAPEGNALSLTDVSGGVTNCYVTTEGASTSGTANPRIVRAYGTTTAALFINNLQVVIGTGANRATGAITNPLVHLGIFGTNRATIVNGVHVRYASGQTQAHKAPTIAVEGYSTGGNSFFDNIVVDLNGLARSEASAAYNGYAGIVNVIECRATNIAIVGTGNPVGALNTALLSLYQAQVAGARIAGGTAGDSTHRWYAMCWLDVESQITDLSMEGGTVSAEKGFLYSGVSGNCRATGVRFDGIGAGTGTVAYVYMDSNTNKFDGLEFIGANVSQCPLVLVEGDNNSIRHHTSDTNGSTTNPVIHVANGTQLNTVADCHIYYNGTTQPGVQYDGDNGFVGNNAFRRTIGATAQVVNTGLNVNIANNNILSTV